MHLRSTRSLEAKLRPSNSAQCRSRVRARSSAFRHSHEEQGIWVTNEVLGDAFRQFTRNFHSSSHLVIPSAPPLPKGHRPSTRTRGSSIRLPSQSTRRHGSSVPGPLEAQRRLAKRRMVGLAHVGASPGVGVDPIALFGRDGPRVEKMVWQAPDLEKAKRESHDRHIKTKSTVLANEGGEAESLPWLGNWIPQLWNGKNVPLPALSGETAVEEAPFKVRDNEEMPSDLAMEPLLIQKLLQAQKTPAGQKSRRAKYKLIAKQKHAFIQKSFKDGRDIWSQLLDIRNLPPVEQLSHVCVLATHVQEQGIDPVEFSKRAFDFFLESDKVTLKVICLFLLEPKLNRPKACNLVRLLDNAAAILRSEQDYDDLARILRVCLKFGTASEKMIHNIIRKAGHILPAINDSNSTVGEGENDKIADTNCKGLLRVYQAILCGLKNCRRRPITSQTIELYLSEISKYQHPDFRAFALQAHIDTYKFQYTQLKPAAQITLSDAITDWVIQSALSQPEIGSSMTPAILHRILRRLVPRAKKSDSHAARLDSEKLGIMTDLLISKLQAAQFCQEDRNKVFVHFLRLLDEELDFQVILTPVLGVLSFKVSQPDLTDFFKTKQQRDICSAFLRFWFPKLPTYRRFDNLREQSLEYSTERTTPKCPANKWTKLSGQFHNALKKLPQNDAYASPFACLLITLNRENLLSIQTQDAILEIMVRLFKDKPSKLIGILKEARNAGVYLYPSLFDKILKNLAPRSPHLIPKLIELTRVYLSRVPQTLIRAAAAGLSPRNLIQILAYDDPWHTVPESERHVAKNDVSMERNVFIHNLADSFSRAKMVALEWRFFNVYECYRHLQDRGSPIHPTMTRALVRTAITAPLSNWQYVTDQRINWILNLVAAVEGFETAAELDTLVWKWNANIRRYRLDYKKVHGVYPRFEQASCGNNSEGAVQDKVLSETTLGEPNRREDSESLIPSRAQDFLIPPMDTLKEPAFPGSEVSATQREELAKFRRKLIAQIQLEFQRPRLEKYFELEDGNDDDASSLLLTRDFGT